MKKIFKYIALALSVAALAACAPDYPELKESELPQASSFDVTVDVDQSTNYVTFNMNNKGVVPVWIVGPTDPIDNAAGSKVTGKNYAYTGNGVKLRFRDAGKHTVEVKAYNANGVSVGSQVIEFSLNETYRDPFDAAPYIKALSNGSSQAWEWNYKENGHFGCGPAGGDGLGWWSCGANEKADWSLYDDKITFAADGTFTYDPGDGQVYVNKGSGVRPDLNTNNEDYLVPWEVTTSTYYVESEWNDAGVEEIYLVTGANVPVSYITDKSELNGSRYLILENETSQIKKCLKLAVTVFTSDNPDGITWHKEFVKEGSNASQTGDPLYGITSKTWVLARDVQGHLGCGPDQGNPAGWWSCGPDEKKDWGVYDDEITFYADGKFVFNPGEGGQIYANKDVTVIGPGVAQAEDYLIDWQIQESTYKVTGDVLTLPEGVVIGYVANNDAITNPTYVITENTDDRLVMVANFNGISWQYIYKPKEGQNPQGGGTWYDVEGATNLWRSATITPEYWYSAGDWSGGINADAQITANNGFTATIPEGVGGAEWQAQNKLISNIKTEAGKKYDFSCTIKADKDMTITIKLTGNPEEEGDIHSFFYNGGVSLEAGDAVTFQMDNLVQNTPTDNVMLIFDFGRSPVGSTITVTDILFQEHKENGGGQPSGLDPNSDANLFKGLNVTGDYWYSAGDWSGGLDPQLTNLGDGKWQVKIPAGIGGAEWQGQTKFHFPVAVSASKVYDFGMKVTPDDDCNSNITVKLAWEGNDNDHAFFYVNDFSAPSDQTTAFVKEGVSPDVDYDAVVLFVDLGRVAAGTTVVISDFCLQEHK